MSQYWIYLLPIAAIAYVLWSRRSAPVGDLKAMVARGAQIVDVRSGGEFRTASHPKAKNIPLAQLESRLKELDPARPVLVCCASGARSGVAVSVLKKAGFTEVANLGPWQRIQTILS
jgi:rhodanese-related sulfurtransferase